MLIPRFAGRLAAESGSLLVQSRLNTAQPTIPALLTPYSPKEVQARLLALAKRGKLPEYRALPPVGVDEAFTVPAFGAPYDRVITARVTPLPEGSRIRFESKLAPRLPAIMIALLVISFWPGVWLTDSMLGLYWNWYHEHIRTWWWYIPMMILSLPVAWKQFKASEAVAAEETTQMLATLSRELAATPAA